VHRLPHDLFGADIDSCARTAAVATHEMKKHSEPVRHIVLWVSQALAQVPTPVTNTDFSKETENPVTRQITLPLRYQENFL